MRPYALTKHTILYLAANPNGTDRLALDREARAIQEELERSKQRDRFEFVTRWAVQPLDLLHDLRRYQPSVVHFSGHGSHNGVGAVQTDGATRRDVVAQGGSSATAVGSGLWFVNAEGNAQLVSATALEATFGALEIPVKLVVLSACYSESQADALLAHVECVVGMSGSILDEAATKFAIGFYGGLGDRASVAGAYQQGRAAISLEGLGDSDRPKLRVRAGLDANRLVLADPR